MPLTNLSGVINVDSLAQEMVDMTQKAISPEMLQKWQTLQSQAKIFIQKMKSIDSLEQLRTKIYTKNYILNPENAIVLKRQYDSFKLSIRQERYELAFAFDELFNNYIGGLPKKILYVYEYRGKIRTYELSLGELIKFMSKDGRLNLNKAQLQAEGRKPIEEKDIFNITPKHLSATQAAYFGTKARLNRYFEKNPVDQKQGGILMWKLGQAWTLARVVNLGDVKEAYSTALINHQEKVNCLCNNAIGEPAYYSHSLISDFFNNYIHGVTNKPAVLGEDTSKDLIQYGIKAQKSSMPALTQYITVATYISTRSSPPTVEKLRAEITNLFPPEKHRNNIIATVKNLSDDVVKDIPELKKLIDSNITLNIFN